MRGVRRVKGLIHIGKETDGKVTTDDATLAGALGKAKPDFVGKRSLAPPAVTEPGRKQLVGLRTRDPKILLEEGAQIVSQSGPGVSIGHVDSYYPSPALKGSTALAMVQTGLERVGQSLLVAMNGGDRQVGIATPVFFVPGGPQLHIGTTHP